MVACVRTSVCVCVCVRVCMSVCVCLVTEYDTVDVLFKLITLDMLLFFMIMRRKQLQSLYIDNDPRREVLDKYC